MAGEVQGVAKIQLQNHTGITMKIMTEATYAALATIPAQPIAMTPDQARAFVAGEVRKWKIVAAAAKIQVD